MNSVDRAVANKIQQNWCELVESVTQAALRVGKSPSEIRIVGVTKYVSANLASILVDAGCRELGESRPQALWQKAESLKGLVGVQWHMIGHMQRNKLRRTLPLINCLHSLDNLRLAEALQSELVARPGSAPLTCFVEVNVSRDPTKTGLPPAELPDFLEQTAQFSMLRVAGLMAMSTLHANDRQIRSEFAQVRELLNAMQVEFGSHHKLTELSMGMSDDYPQAIAEGATLVRIGSLLWKGIESEPD